MATRVEVGSGPNSARAIVQREMTGSIYPALELVLQTYANTRCTHSEETKGRKDGAQLCEPCSEEVLRNVRKAVGSGDVDWNADVQQKLEDLCFDIPRAALVILAANAEDEEKGCAEVADVVTATCDVVKVCTDLYQNLIPVKAFLKS